MKQKIGFGSEEELFIGKKEKLILPKAEIRLKEIVTDFKADDALEYHYALLIVDEYLRGLAYETITTINLNSDIALNYCICSIGTPESTPALIGIRNMLTSALLSNASDVIIVHNHPEGSAKPSEADIDCFMMKSYLLQSIGIKLKDAYIIGIDNPAPYSLREDYPEMFADMIDKYELTEIK